MKEEFEKNLDLAPKERRARWSHQQMTGVGCNTCHHEIAARAIPMSADQHRRLSMKRRNSGLLVAGGVGTMLVALYVLWMASMVNGHTNLWYVFLFMMIVGIMATFVGLETLVIGYKTFQEEIEESGSGLSR
jgi:hypothetical protein